ncbi:basic amino acid/polyamine antiporter [Flammeovirga sp. SubArs3]|uniref:basic amino acid/polyamine antiporter n=1 Tax=Flammeovirga sp. SubArs3 TaxID=2995316 RepID=UPI00248A9E34|nr:basic amino acid/polyamine antiporter [Flammeovirga sp. SubArs3]
MENEKKVGLWGLVAIVFGSMIGGGIFNIPQNMASNAGLGAVMLSWVISGIGIWFLVEVFKSLEEKHPELSSGIYAYAQKGFGNFVGFSSAWGYWIAAIFGNVAFAVLLNDALGIFFPSLLEHGWQTVVFGSVLVWLMTTIVWFGVNKASSLNTLSTVAKFLSLIVIFIMLIVAFDFDVFTADIWRFGLGGIGKQIKGTMMVTLWCFIGIEGAVVISGKAKKKSDVSKATIIGFAAALLMYLLLSALSFGILKQEELSVLSSPSTGGLLQAAVGSDWGLMLVNVAVIISVSGAWLAWTILVAETPYSAAKDGILPKIFSKDNAHQSPGISLLMSSIIVQLALFIVVSAKDVYLAAVDIAGVMILPSYLLSSMFLLKEVLSKKGYSMKIKVIALLSSLYCLWLIYAAGINFLLLSMMFYAVGIPFYLKARKEQNGSHVFANYEKWIAGTMISLSFIGVYIISTGAMAL